MQALDAFPSVTRTIIPFFEKERDPDHAGALLKPACRRQARPGRRPHLASAFCSIFRRTKTVIPPVPILEENPLP
jgi:hypothetical protein